MDGGAGERERVAAEAGATGGDGAPSEGLPEAAAAEAAVEQPGRAPAADGVEAAAVYVAMSTDSVSPPRSPRSPRPASPPHSLRSASPTLSLRPASLLRSPRSDRHIAEAVEIAERLDAAPLTPVRRILEEGTGSGEAPGEALGEAPAGGHERRPAPRRLDPIAPRPAGRSEAPARGRGRAQKVVPMLDVPSGRTAMIDSVSPSSLRTGASPRKRPYAAMAPARGAGADCDLDALLADVSNQTLRHSITRAHVLGTHNFEHEGARCLFDDLSLGFRPQHWLRRRMLLLLLGSWFDALVLGLIFLNSLVLGLADYETVNSDGGLSDASARNAFVLRAMGIFTWLFAAEMLVRVAGTGWRSYVSDHWNKLDAFVTVAGVLDALIPADMPGISILRALRVLRPLRSISQLHSLKVVVTTILAAFGKLATVLGVLAFILLIFSIVAVNVYAGRMHYRCRLTPWPVQLDWMPGDDAHAKACVNASDPGRFTDLGTRREDSFWRTPRDCFWPIDEDCFRLCATDKPTPVSQNYQCDAPGRRVTNRYPELERHCGSDYDAWKNPRFRGGAAIPFYGNRTFTQRQLTHHGIYNVQHGWGLEVYDDIGISFLNVFRVMTLEEWTRLMNSASDAHDRGVAVVIFVALVLFGALVSVNLVLAVLESTFHSTKRAAAPHFHSPKSARERLRAMSSASIVAFRGIAQRNPVADALGALVPQALRAWWQRVRRGAAALVSSAAFTDFYNAAIVLNVLLLAINRYPVSDAEERATETATFVLTLLFCAEILAKMVAFGAVGFFRDASERSRRRVRPVFFARRLDSRNLSGRSSLTSVASEASSTRSERGDGLWNAFDLAVTSLSVLQLFLYPPAVLGGDGGRRSGTSALRAFRAVRMLKLVREWEDLNALLKTIIRALYESVSLLVLFALVVYIYTLLGMEFFANRLCFDGDGYPLSIAECRSSADAHVPDANFDDIVSSFISVFIVLTGETWPSIMNDAWRAEEQHPWMALLYFVSLILIGYVLLLNLFLAILLSAFESKAAQERSYASSSFAAPLSPRQALPRLPSEASGESGGTPVHGSFQDDPESPPGRRGSIGMLRTLVRGDSMSVRSSNDGYMDSTREMRFAGGGSFWTWLLSPEKDDVEMRGVSLGFLDANSGIRRWCWAVSESRAFSIFMTACIAVSCVHLVLDNPFVDPGSPLKRNLDALNAAIIAVFGAEMLLRIVAHGLYGGADAYLRDAFNVVDMLIVLTSVLDLFASDLPWLRGLRAVRVLRAMRALRPLTVIRRVTELQLIVKSLVYAMRPMVYLVGILIVVYSIFGILSVSLFKGTLRACEGDALASILGSADGDFYLDLLQHPRAFRQLSPAQQDLFLGDNAALLPGLEPGCSAAPCCAAWRAHGAEAAPTSRIVCECYGQGWAPVVDQLFDHLGVAILSLFELSTTEGWTEVLFAAMASRGVDAEPIPRSNTAVVLFFITFMFLGSIFAVNLFVGVVYETFCRKRKEEEGSTAMNARQREYVKAIFTTSRALPRLQVRPPQCRVPGLRQLRALCYAATRGRAFDAAVYALIAVNTLVLTLTYFGMSTVYEQTLDSIQAAFAIAFTLEFLVRFAAEGRMYFRDAWNRFDFALVVGTGVLLLLRLLRAGSAGTFVNALRAFRVLRALRLARGTTAQVGNTMLRSLASLSYMALLLLLMYFVFGLIGIQLFAKVAFRGEIDEHTNFRGIGSAILALFRFSTGEGWNTFMHDLAEAPRGCAADPQYDERVCGFRDAADCQPLDGCGSPASFVFMPLFFLVVGFILLNLVIGIIIQGFKDSDEQATVVTDRHFERFRDAWAAVDPAATGEVSYDGLRRLLLGLERPLGAAGRDGRLDAFIDTLELVAYRSGDEACFTYRTVLLAVVKDAFDRETDDHVLDGAMLKRQRAARHKIRSAFRSIDGTRDFIRAADDAPLSTADLRHLLRNGLPLPEPSRKTPMSVRLVGQIKGVGRRAAARMRSLPPERSPENAGKDAADAADAAEQKQLCQA